MKSNPMPVKMMQETFSIDESSKTGLRRNERPREHFKTEARWKYYNRRFANSDAGCLKGINQRPDPRYMVSFNGSEWQVSRVIWAIHNGIDPADNYIDHIDGNQLNNSLSNLRCVNMVQSLANRRAKGQNPSGYQGVHRAGKSWVARIRINGNERVIGRYRNLEDAIKARIEAEEFLHGDFSYHRSRQNKSE
jgi:hypothetical protein